MKYKIPADTKYVNLIGLSYALTVRFSNIKSQAVGQVKALDWPAHNRTWYLVMALESIDYLKPNFRS